MLIIQENLFLTHQDNQENVIFPFVLQDAISELRIHFAYGPSKSSDAVAKAQVQEAIAAYVPKTAPAIERDVESYLPVENFITVSLAYEGSYLGNYHNKAKDQEILISQKGSSPGFYAQALEAGSYELQLNCHCIASERVKICLEVEAVQ